MILIELEVLVVRADLVAIARQNDSKRARIYKTLNFMGLYNVNTMGVEQSLEYRRAVTWPSTAPPLKSLADIPISRFLIATEKKHNS